MSMEEAIGTLSVMFESFDKETLLAVLDANEGHLERTIDALLAMQDDNEAAVREAAGISSTPPPAPVQRMVSQTSRNRIELPQDFLRVPGASVDQEAQDRMLAEMLQNEIFRQEIQADQDIRTYIGYDGRRRSVDSSHQEKSAMEMANDTMVAVGEKISHVSEAVKGKIFQMYARFQTRNASNDPSQRPLMALSDDEGDERRGIELQERDGEVLRRRQGSKGSPRQARSYSNSFHSKKD